MLLVFEEDRFGIAVKQMAICFAVPGITLEVVHKCH